MENDKSNTSADDFEELADEAWGFAFHRSGDSKVLQAFAILTESSERLKRSTEESSKQANLLSSAIKKLTGWLVGLTIAAVVLAAVSLFVLWTSAR
jgi:hypothetical protein